MKHSICFSHTGTLQIHHVIYNKWLPQSSHYIFLGMLCRSQLSAIDFNLAADSELSGRESPSFAKITKTWSTKLIKVSNGRNKFEKMIERVVVSLEESGEVLPLLEMSSFCRETKQGSTN